MFDCAKQERVPNLVLVDCADVAYTQQTWFVPETERDLCLLRQLLEVVRLIPAGLPEDFV